MRCYYIIWVQIALEILSYVFFFFLSQVQHKQKKQINKKHTKKPPLDVYSFPGTVVLPGVN